MNFDPILLIAMWAAGIAAASAAVAWWSVARRGFLLLAAGVVVLVGFAAAIGELWGIAGVVAALVAAASSSSPRAASVAFAASAAAFLAVGLGRDDLLPVVAGSVALGGITTEMLLGHWYLVDPQLPRWALRRLDAAGIVGIVGEIVVAGVRGTLRSPTDIAGLAYLMLAVGTVALSVMVWFSLAEKGYEGVMAATGLSYLATLTVLGAVFLARIDVTAILGVG